MYFNESQTAPYVFRTRCGGAEYRVVATPVERAANGVVFDIHFPENSTFDTRITLPDGSSVDKALKQAATTVLRLHGVTGNTQQDDIFPKYF